MYTKKVLLIEDDAILADVLMRKLSLEGFSGYHSSDGRAGIAEIKRIHPDLILLDIALPGMDGFAVLEALRSETERGIRDIPVIVISNSGQPVEIDRALQYGVKDYCVKASFDPGEIAAKVRKHLGLSETASLEAVPTGLLHSKKLLIIEDDQFLRDLAIQKLKKEQLEVISAVNGEEGLEMALTEKPSIILLDILLPGMDGFEVLRRVKAAPEIAGTSVIMLSNFGQREDVEKAKALGAEAFLVKANYTLDEVTDEIKKVIAKKSRQ